MKNDLNLSALTKWLGNNIDGYTGPLTYEKFSGGQSNPTFKLITPNRQYVLRRKPAGNLLKGAHAIDREYRITSALHAKGFPVPKTYGFCENPSIIGADFYVMEMVEGRIFWDPALPEVPKDDRPAYFDAMNGTLAALHSLDYNSMGLSDYGREGNFLERQVTLWSKQYLMNDLAGRLDTMDQMVEWLPANLPTEREETKLIHGDFRCDNMIFHPTEPKIIAVLDWELSTLGNPISDFAYHLMKYRLPSIMKTSIKNIDYKKYHLPSEAEYIAAYCKHTHRSSIPNIDFYIAFNMFRFASILHGIKGRFLAGNASSTEADVMISYLEPLAEAAWQQAQLAN